LERLSSKGFVGDDLPAVAVDIPREHIARTAAVFIEPTVELVRSAGERLRRRHTPRATFRIPVAELDESDLYGRAVVAGNHKRDRLIIGDRDIAGIVKKKEVVRALLERFAFVVSVYIVLDLRTARRKRVIGSGRRIIVFVPRVAVRV
jgi:hypothetical protein